MPGKPSLFTVEQQDETMILSPTKNLSELELSFLDHEIRGVMRELDQSDCRNVVLDFNNTDYYGSTALGFFLVLWKRVRANDGQMAFCHVSTHEREVLRLTKLDHLWPICATRQEALDTFAE